MKTDTQGLIDRYLKELERELGALPRSRRCELMDDVGAHIADAHAETGDDQLAIRKVLDRLGDPSEIAADARERFGIEPAKVGFMEVLALILLPVGGIILPIVGWFAGVVLLWVSPAWVTRDKIIGTLVVPGGYGTTLFMMFMSVSPSTGECVERFGRRGRLIETVCTGEAPSGLEEIGLWLLSAFLLVGPLAGAIYLGYRLRRRPATS